MGGVGMGVVFEAVDEFDTVLPVRLGVSDLWVSIREVEILRFPARGFLEKHESGRMLVRI